MVDLTGKRVYHLDGNFLGRVTHDVGDGTAWVMLESGYEHLYVTGLLRPADLFDELNDTETQQLYAKLHRAWRDMDPHSEIETEFCALLDEVWYVLAQRGGTYSDG